MLEAGECFAHNEASQTARWALVYLLRATGDADDGDRAEALAETLIEDWQRFEGWRLVERYCPTDPCDPASERPNEKIGRAHVCTPVTNAHLVCRLLLEKKKQKPINILNVHAEHKP